MKTAFVIPVAKLTKVRYFHASIQLLTTDDIKLWRGHKVTHEAIAECVTNVLIHVKL